MTSLATAAIIAARLLARSKVCLADVFILVPMAFEPAMSSPRRRPRGRRIFVSLTKVSPAMPWSTRHILPAVLIGLLLIKISGGSAQQRSPTGKPWIDMDYGPFLTASVEVGPDNIANKGIVIRLDRGSGGVAAGHEFMIFDTDSLRMAAAWSGSGCLDWQNVAFDGQHGKHCSIAGDALFRTRDEPGWGDAQQRFEDKRLVGRDGHRYGPLPRDWARWRGLYRYEDRVVLAYDVGEVAVLESPTAISVGQQRVLVRTLQLPTRERPMTLQVAHAAAGGIHLQRPDGARRSFNTEVGLLAAGDPAGPHVACFAVNSTTVQTEWQVTNDGALRLKILPGAAGAVNVLCSQLNAVGEGAGFSELADQCQPMEDLNKFTRGGPRQWTEITTTQVQPLAGSDESAPFAVDQLTLPTDNPYRSWMRLGGFDFFADARKAAVCTWQGDVWLVDGLGLELNQLRWTRIAAGMFQPLGLKIVRETIYVTCRDQLTILRDLNGDGETDFYENFNNDAQVTEHFHEFAMDLQTDEAGNFYYAKSARHALDALVPQHGTLIKVSPDGTHSEVLASGFRAANGVCVNADGTFIISDQEGHWTPKNRINWITPGNFYGNMMGWQEGRSENDFELPIVWIHNNFDRSPAEQLWVPPSSAWQELRGSLLNLSYGTGEMHVVLMQEVNGRRQGGLVRLPGVDFPTGVMRGRFHPQDGQLYCCGLFGWSSNKTTAGGFYRVRRTAQPLNLPVRLQATTAGMRITFSDPLDLASARDFANYAVTRWNYRRSANYGSDDFSVKNPRKKGRDRVRVDAAEVSQEGRTVLLRIPDMQPSMQMEISYRLKAANGVELSQTIHNTIHEVASEQP